MMDHADLAVINSIEFFEVALRRFRNADDAVSVVEDGAPRRVSSIEVKTFIDQIVNGHNPLAAEARKEMRIARGMVDLCIATRKESQKSVAQCQCRAMGSSDTGPPQAPEVAKLAAPALKAILIAVQPHEE